MDGSVAINVLSFGSAKLANTDRIVEAERRANETEERLRNETQARRVKLKGFVAAKQAARNKGKGVSTLQEYEASAGPLADDDVED
ncbi:hypothetical protein LTR27_006338 [Elasticomyces elasticus]|nr:hypothetical protein LTR27_006338 [Elasticomyces elasticus]